MNNKVFIALWMTYDSVLAKNGLNYQIISENGIHTISYDRNDCEENSKIGYLESA